MLRRAILRQFSKWSVHIGVVVLVGIAYQLHSAPTCFAAVKSIVNGTVVKNKSESVQFESVAPASETNCGVTIAIVLCRDERVFAEKDGKLLRAFDRQISQVLVLLKSVILAERYSPDLLMAENRTKCIHVIIVANYKDIFTNLASRIMDHVNWDPIFSQYLELSYIPAVYPKEYEWMSSVYRPCATIRLFLDTILPDVDAIIYTDTDIIYFRSLQYLWKEFKRFTDEMIAGLIPEYNNPFYVRKNYNPSAYNSGIMLMNLTRMRNIGWSQRIGMVCSLYLKYAQWADQDILVIYFQYFPHHLLDISCDWNFAPRNCRFGKICAEQGISAVHGLAGSFAKPNFEIYFKKLFNAYNDLSLNMTFLLPKFVMEVGDGIWRNNDTSHHLCNDHSNFGELIMKSIQQFQLLDTLPHSSRTTWDKRYETADGRLRVGRRNNSVPFAITFCDDPTLHLKEGSPYLERILTLLEFLVARKIGPGFVHIFVLSPSIFTFDRLRYAVHSLDERVKNVLRLKFIQGEYPSQYKWMEDDRCTTLSLFYSELLPWQDTVIYLDPNAQPFTNIMYLSANFQHFKYPTILGTQMIGSFPNKFNTGVLLMNLTRMRSAGFSRHVKIIATFYQEELPCSVQDIFEVYFRYFPQQVTLFDYAWNPLRFS